MGSDYCAQSDCQAPLSGRSASALKGYRKHSLQSCGSAFAQSHFPYFCMVIPLWASQRLEYQHRGGWSAPSTPFVLSCFLSTRRLQFYAQWFPLAHKRADAVILNRIPVAKFNDELTSRLPTTLIQIACNLLRHSADKLRKTTKHFNRSSTCVISRLKNCRTFMAPAEKATAAVAPRAAAKVAARARATNPTSISPTSTSLVRRRAATEHSTIETGWTLAQTES